MTRTMRKLAGAAALTVVGMAVIAIAGERHGELREINCAQLTVFVPENGQTGEDLCKAHGGLAATRSTTDTPALVILVRNQPVGGADGLRRN